MSGIAPGQLFHVPLLYTPLPQSQNSISAKYIERETGLIFFGYLIIRPGYLIMPLK